MALKKNGFTLVELLVVVGITAMAGIMVANIFLTNLRTTAKAKALTEVKQNGDYALAVMERMIRNAKELSPCSGSGMSLTLLNPDEDTTTFDCSGDQIASNSGFLSANNLKVTNCSLICEKPQGKPAVVTISFTLKKKGAALGKEFTAEIPFQTTVSTRLY